MAVPLHKVSILLRAVEGAAVGEQPVQGRLAGRGGMLLGVHSGSRGRGSQRPAGEAQCQQGCPQGRRRPKPSKPRATRPPHASPARLVSSFSRHALPLRAAPSGLLELEKYTEMSVASPCLPLGACGHRKRSLDGIHAGTLSPSDTSSFWAGSEVYIYISCRFTTILQETPPSTFYR